MVKPETIDRLSIFVGLNMIVWGMAYLSPAVSVIACGVILVTGALYDRDKRRP
jgi:hypothetical protein